MTFNTVHNPHSLSDTSVSSNNAAALVNLKEEYPISPYTDESFSFDGNQSYEIDKQRSENLQILPLSSELQENMGFPMIDTSEIITVPTPNLQTFESPTHKGSIDGHIPIRGQYSREPVPITYETPPPPPPPQQHQERISAPYVPKNSTLIHKNPLTGSCLLITTPTPAPSTLQRKWNKPRSLTGCYICRLRHLKCDEQKPQCLRCERIGIHCDYQEQINDLGDKVLKKPDYITDKNLRELKLAEIKKYTSNAFSR